MRFTWSVVATVVVLAIIYLTLSWIVDGYFGGNIYPNNGTPSSWSPPNSWSEWRDIMIILMALFWALAGMLTAVLLAVLIWLALLIRRILKENAVPALDSLKDSLDNVRGTTEFAGETVVSPIIRTYSVIKGVRSGLRAATSLGDRISRRRKKGK